MSNLTEQIETFVEKVHDDIDSNYASIRNLLEVINIGVSQVLEIQGFLQAEVTTLSGVLYFLAQFLAILFLTSFKKYQGSRNYLLTFMTVQIVLELTVFSFLTTFLSIKHLRSIFIFMMIIHLISKGNS